MGADQSTPRRGRPPGPQGQSAPSEAGDGAKKCYYELLEVDRDAADDDIRKAYRRKALELHPDRNLNDTETATRRFAEVQTAYEVLSDPQERAWYDSHRDVILGRHDSESADAADHGYGHATPAQAVYALMARFNSSVPMDDSPRGFFGGLGAFFDQLAEEELAHAAQPSPVPYPPFGSAHDSYGNVARPFYQAWSNFSTTKSFAWVDKFRLNTAPDRQIRRLMEKENKKSREDATRAFNDAIRSLVAFAKKRDPRYVPNAQSETERQQVLRDTAAAQAAKARAANQAKVAEYVVPEWAERREEGGHVSEFSEAEEDSDVYYIECVTCNKVFKSENQFHAHEKSRKHVKAVKQLQRLMNKEDQELDLDKASQACDREGAPEQLVSSDISALGDDQQTHLAEAPDTEAPDTEAPDTEALASSADFTCSESDKNNSAESKTPGNDEYAARTIVEARLGAQNTLTTESREENQDIMSKTQTGADLPNTQGEVTIKTKGKAKQKREKKAARSAPQETGLRCTECGTSFGSRTQLFAHLKTEDHYGSTKTASRTGRRK